jgi:capsular exopolysaccharide synthesis family protein
MAIQSNTSIGARSAPGSQGNLIDLRKVFGIVRRRQLWALATAAIVMILTLIAYKAADPMYSAVARVALDRRVDELVASSPTSATLPTDSSSVDTEVQVLTSPRVAAAVVDKLQLAQRIGFGQSAKGPAVPAAQARARAIDVVRNGLMVKREGTSYAIKVGYSNGNPSLATAIVNAAVDEYVTGQRTDKVAERTRETALLGDRLATLREDVLRAESAVARYRQATNLIDVQKDSTAVQQQLSALNTQLAAAKAEQAAADSKLNAARSGASAEGLDSSVLSTLRSQRAELSAKKADLAGRYGELHPSVSQINRQIDALDASIATETQRVRAGYMAEARVAQGRASSIESSLARAQGALGQANSASVELNELERNAESARVLYQALLDRYRQSVTGQGTERSNAYIIARAIEPRAPDSPNLGLYLLAGVVASLLAASSVILVLEMLESGFQSRADVEANLSIPVLASIPDLAAIVGARFSRRDPMAPANYLISHEGSIFNESFRSIRAGLAGQGRDIRVLAVSSALPDEGKTTASICLARSAALAGMRTLLIDCDVRRRASSRSLSDNAKSGLIEVLKGQAQIRDALVKDDASGAWLLAQSKSTNHDHDVIASAAMKAMLASLREQFDLIILDTAPVLALAEARSVGAMADGVLFAVRWRKTPVQAAQLALDQLERAGATVVGAALTQVNLQQQARTGSGDEMVYYNRFKSYYAT